MATASSWFEEVLGYQRPNRLDAHRLVGSRVHEGMNSIMTRDQQAEFDWGMKLEDVGLPIEFINSLSEGRPNIRAGWIHSRTLRRIRSHM